MKYQRIALIDNEVFCIIYVSLHVLCKIYISQLICFAVSWFFIYQTRKGIQQITSFFYIKAHRIRITVCRSHRISSSTIISISISQAHNEQIFVTMSQQWINLIHTIQIIVECRWGIGHINIIYIQQVKTMISLSSPCPTIAPGSRS